MFLGLFVTGDFLSDIQLFVNKINPFSSKKVTFLPTGLKMHSVETPPGHRSSRTSGEKRKSSAAKLLKNSNCQSHVFEV